MKKKILGAFAALSPFALLAEGSTPTVDTASATGAITAIETSMTTVITSLAGAVVAIVLAGVGIWMIPRIAGALKSAFQGGKGR